MPFLPFDAAGNWSSEVTWALLDAEAGTVGTRIFAKINHSVLEQSCPCVYHSVPGSREGQTQLELLSGGIREYVWSPYRRRNLHISVQWDLKSERSLLILSYNFWIDNILQLLHQAWHPPFVQEATESLLKKLRNSWGLKDHHTSLKVLSCWPAFIYLFFFFWLLSWVPDHKAQNHRKAEKYNKWAFSTHPEQSFHSFNKSWVLVKGKPWISPVLL